MPVPTDLSLAVPPAPPNFIPARPSGSRASGRSPSAAHASFFAGEAALSNGVYYLALPNGNPFGYYSYLTDSNYIYHFDAGYEYVVDANDGKGGVYFYDFASSHWWYTGLTFPFPYLYDFSLKAFLYYDPDTNNAGHYTTNPRYFYNFGTQQTITMPAVLVPAGDTATSLAEGSDGNVWFTAAATNGGDAQAGRYTVASGAVDHFALPNADANPNLATVGGDGGVWFFEQARTRFARISTSGALQEFSAAFGVSAMTKGPDGNVWFLTTQSPPQIGKITPTGTITTYQVPSDGFEPRTLTSAAGRLWLYAMSVSPNGALASIATDGTGYTTTTISGLVRGSVGAAMYLGKDGNFYLGIPTAGGFGVHQVTPAGAATDACTTSSRNGFVVTTQLDDGTIIFGLFQNSFGVPTILAILPTGVCRADAFALNDPIDQVRLFSGAGDGSLYGYSLDRT
ncbi:MAG TPA: hypothetical protein VN224_16345, partial [Xanthomonadales bacterium]|nr:hypothetical protein [Xanthomonadales bacterium]